MEVIDGHKIDSLEVYVIQVDSTLDKSQFHWTKKFTSC